LPGKASALNQRDYLTSLKIYNKNTFVILFLTNHNIFQSNINKSDLAIYLTKGSNHVVKDLKRKQMVNVQVKYNSLEALNSTVKKSELDLQHINDPLLDILP
jgi:hypothetical protein